MRWKEEKFYFLEFVLSNKERKKKVVQQGKVKEPEFHKIFWSAFTGLFNFHRAM